MGVSSFARDYWYVVVGAHRAAACSPFAARCGPPAGRYPLGQARSCALPVIGKLVHEASLARITRSLSISLTAGMPMIQTLKIIAHAAGNEYMAERVSRLREAVERGEPVSRAAASVGMFSPLVLQMIAIGEETGDALRAARRSRRLLRARGRPRAEESERRDRADPDRRGRRHGLILALGVFLPLWEMISRVQV